MKCSYTIISHYTYSFPGWSGEKEYYERQFAILRSFEEVESLESPHVIDEDQSSTLQAQHERAMKISYWANVFLLVFKVHIELLILPSW